MNEFVLRGPHREVIDTAGKWRGLVPKDHWGRGKPLTELATRWTTTSLPEIDQLLATQPRTRDFSVEEGWIDGKLDVAVAGVAAGGRTLLAALSLADEPLGPLIAEARAAQQRRFADSPVEAQAQSVFRVEASVIDHLRYRLLDVADDLLKQAHARGCAQAVLVFHEFRSAYSPKQIVADQASDLESFVLSLSHRRESVQEAGRLTGPLTSALPLFLGRALGHSFL